MNVQPMFAVSRFKNRNGVFSFRVDGYLNGVRIRRNFKTQEEADARHGTRCRLNDELPAIRTHVGHRPP